MSEKALARTSRRSPLPSTEADVGASVDTVYDRVVQAVMEHRLPPGTKLVEEKLATVFSITRTRVREVLQRLAHEGLVNAIPNRGSFIASPTVEEARQIFDARRILEPALVRRLVADADAEDIQRLRAHVAAERQARAEDDRRAIIRLSGEFHLLMAEMVGNPQLTQVMRELASLTCLIILLYDSPNMPACPNHEHSELIDAIETRDEAQAVRCIVEHLQHIEETLDLSGDEGPEIDLESIFA
ncbi:MAG: GntR family transcriptional regulator [Candidatus Dactylopiibacterium carminicum]|uniref:GntR family transcriptional regulator n=1 Tax=Candidatus Dactylopiibacterium carminicum TaxID=857335 RepID=A0A272EVQ8_9RHOO|nr:GntR family transcriptional regulator [Candidatus Dactylopiibacterium carminicum]KAF7599923.1 GntR family transcriptional regulator [Candidatus Dactylopiibacterium carminicum]PAS94199.1 MAG: GntR family transcriptional regulator [Candidatus Dactylopiibacterium carminicum]PAS96758.1 MAG: GntR family transcriptional regulator [Candidatus Dactylopiibacterium carminicum]PAS99925.1 MAG: GntR family transcriptional regulator [Candidatus Dactylopiibacterium carminicum]